jgi:predicted ATPase
LPQSLAESGLVAVYDALALSDRLGERFWQAGMLHRKGAMLISLSADRRAEAERCYQESLEISVQQQARSIGLRAATSLARLWHGEGRSGDARDLLTPLYGWFTEGFDTPDLTEACSLLQELT